MERHCTRVHSSGRLPGKITFDAVTGLLIREALVGLEEHHRASSLAGILRRPSLEDLYRSAK